MFRAPISLPLRPGGHLVTLPDTSPALSPPPPPVLPQHDFTTGSEQLAWLESDLKAVDRTITPWVVVTTHRFIYSTQTDFIVSGDYAISQHLRVMLEPLMYTYKVSLVLSGHAHSYERSCAITHGQCVEDNAGTVYITAGTAGAKLVFAPFSPAMGPWSKKSFTDWGYMRIVATTTELKLQFVLNSDGSIADEFVVPRFMGVVPQSVLAAWTPEAAAARLAPAALEAEQLRLIALVQAEQPQLLLQHSVHPAGDAVAAMLAPGAGGNAKAGALHGGEEDEEEDEDYADDPFDGRPDSGVDDGGDVN